jgi:hypothetical protein
VDAQILGAAAKNFIQGPAAAFAPAEQAAKLRGKLTGFFPAQILHGAGRICFAPHPAGKGRLLQGKGLLPLVGRAAYKGAGFKVNKTARKLVKGWGAKGGVCLHGGFFLVNWGDRPRKSAAAGRNSKNPFSWLQTGSKAHEALLAGS